MSGQLIFFDANADIVHALRCYDIDAIHTDDPVSDLDFRWIVSPANCYGPMDGGFDRYLANWLNICPDTGWRPFLDGDLPLDLSEPYLEVGDVRVWASAGVIIAATVHKPVSRVEQPANEVHIRSILDNLVTYASATVTTIACPGLGTGFGGISPDQFAALVCDATALSEVDV